MVFAVKDKVVLVTGGASGLGLAQVKELLKNGVKGVTIADNNEKISQQVTEELQNEFGRDKVIFVKTDVTSKESFENAFKITVETFKFIDILINNAGIFNDLKWELEVDINLKGTIHGVILGLETYLKNHKQGEEAVIVNTSSLNGVYGFGVCPVYGSTKFAVNGLTKCWGIPFHYERTKVRVVSICPGFIHTPLLTTWLSEKNTLKPEYFQVYEDAKNSFKTQAPESVATETIRILEKAPNGTLWLIEGDEPAYEYIFEDRLKYKNNILK